jgi:hypothetical protein
VSEWLFWPVALAACVPAWQGDRTAGALLASLAYSEALELSGTPFSPFLWGMADLCVLAVIERPYITLRDELISALFIPAWFSYFLDPLQLYETGMAVVMAQFILVCIPAKAFSGHPMAI